MDLGADRRRDTRLMARSAAAIYAGAVVVGFLGLVTPGGEDFSPVPGFCALVILPIVVVFGPRLPATALGALGPLGVALISLGIATTQGTNDTAMLYVWPVLWMSYFFGSAGTAIVLGCVAAGQATAMLALPPGEGSIDRWIDVMVSMTVLGLVVRALAARADRLVGRLAAQARIDPLTGLLNRRGLEERLQAQVARLQREGGMLGIASFDIDRFKAINDAHGHEVGDRVLEWVAAIVARETRAADCAGRIGGEEFLVVLSGADIASTFALAERVREAIEATPLDAGALAAPLPVTVSAGVASAAAPLDVAALLGEADAGLYAAKRSGRNRTMAADPAAAFA